MKTLRNDLNSMSLRGVDFNDEVISSKGFPG